MQPWVVEMIQYSTQLVTLGVVGVVRVLNADAHNTSRGQKVPNFDYDPPFHLLQNEVGCPPYPYKNFVRKSYL